MVVANCGRNLQWQMALSSAEACVEDVVKFMELEMGFGDFCHFTQGFCRCVFWSFLPRSFLFLEAWNLETECRHVYIYIYLYIYILYINTPRWD